MILFGKDPFPHDDSRKLKVRGKEEPAKPSGHSRVLKRYYRAASVSDRCSAAYVLAMPSAGSLPPDPGAAEFLVIGRHRGSCRCRLPSSR